ncbi:MAG: hypothetical protein FWH42_02230 [Dehalococcoidia bacterium]|nr:hypothetical protein [Dehalococcoidia bacterium]
MKNKMAVFVCGVLVIGCVAGSACSKLDDIPYVFKGVVQLDTYNLPPVDIILKTDLPESIPTIVAYKIVRPKIDDKYASNIAKQLGFTGNSVPLGNEERIVYTYVSGEQILEVWLNGYILLYGNIDLKIPTNLPSDEECVAIATKWLKDNNMCPDNVVSITTSPRGGVQFLNSETGRLEDSYRIGTEVTFSIAIDDVAVESGGATVVIGDNGTILRMETHKYSYEKAFDVSLIEASKALKIMEDRLTSPTPPDPENIECIVNMRSFSNLEITGVALNYQYSTSNGYLLPIYVFTGDAYDENVPDKMYGFVGKVDATSR